MQRVDGFRQARFTLLVGAIAHQRVFNVAERRQYRLAIVQHCRPLLRASHLDAGDQPTALENRYGNLRAKAVEVAAPVGQPVRFAVTQAKLSGEGKAREQLCHRDANLRRGGMEIRLGFAHVRATARQGGRNTGLHNIRQGGHRLHGLQFGIQRARRLTKEDRQPVHRLAFLRLILRQLRFKIAQLRPGIFHVHLRRQPAPLAAFGQIQRLLRAFNLRIKRGNDALRPTQL